VIASLVTHDAKVTILGSSKDGALRVVVRNHDGAVVADGITVDELRVSDPLLHVLVTNAIASGRGDSPYLDATLERAPTARAIR
jgi:hypothetical protein